MRYPHPWQPSSQEGGVYIFYSLRAGKYLRSGHDVTLVTRRGKQIWFRFDRIEGDAVVGHTRRGEEVAVAIPDVARLTTDRLSIGRTIPAAAGGVSACATLFMAALVAIAS